MCIFTAALFYRHFRCQFVLFNLVGGLYMSVSILSLINSKCIHPIYFIDLQYRGVPRYYVCIMCVYIYAVLLFHILLCVSTLTIICV